MISTEKCLYLIDQNLEKLSTSANQYIPVEDKLLALNKAQIEAILTKVDVNNQYRIGLDGFRKRYEDLEVLIQPYEAIQLIPSETKNIYNSSLQKLSKKYFLYTSIYVEASKGTCKDITIDVNIIPHADVRTLINNNNYKPSFEYQETLGTISSNLLEIYTDGTFTPTKSYISYLTYPDEFDIPGYIKLDGTESSASNSNLPDYMENEIVSIATRYLALQTGNQLMAQASQITNSKNS